MRLCIICENDKVEAVRIKMKNQTFLRIGLSENGSMPASHWFCCMATTQDRAEKLLATVELTHMEISEPKEFLEKWNLQIIK